MLAPKAQYDLRNAKAYFEEHLAVGDYYTEGQMVAGEWIGKGAESLRLVATSRWRISLPSATTMIRTLASD